MQPRVLGTSLVLTREVTVVAVRSAWAGLEEEATVDEEEAIRNYQRGASRGDHTPEKRERKVRW